MTSLLAFSAFTATIKEYKDCSLQSINFETFKQGEYIFSCDNQEKRLSRFPKLAEENLIQAFTNRSPFSTGTRNLLVSTSDFSIQGQEEIVGFTTSDEVKSLKKIRFNRLNGQITDTVGNVLLTVTKEQVAKSELNNYLGLRIKFHQGDRFLIQRTRDPQYVNTLSVVENCFPKRCGQTTYLLLRENASIGSFPESDGLHR